jgi:hypothetical protein
MAMIMIVCVGMRVFLAMSMLVGMAVPVLMVVRMTMLCTVMLVFEVNIELNPSDAGLVPTGDVEVIIG